MKRISIFLAVVLLISACKSQKQLSVDKSEYMENAYTAIKSNVPEAEVTLLNDTIKVLFPENLLFALGKSEISETNYPLLERFANALNKYATTSILINGYTDNSDSEELNEVLSRNRALSTRDVLKHYSVDEKRMYTWGRGVKNPIASNKTAEGRRKNRRVEFIILYTYTHVADDPQD